MTVPGATELAQEMVNTVNLVFYHNLQRENTTKQSPGTKTVRSEALSRRGRAEGGLPRGAGPAGLWGKGNTALVPRASTLSTRAGAAHLSTVPQSRMLTSCEHLLREEKRSSPGRRGTRQQANQESSTPRGRRGAGASFRAPRPQPWVRQRGRGAARTGPGMEDQPGSVAMDPQGRTSTCTALRDHTGFTAPSADPILQMMNPRPRQAELPA